MSLMNLTEEQVFLEKEREKFPHLFQQTTLIEDAKFLETFGIYIPGKEELPYGHLKLLPTDFIVEEILPDGTVCTIEEPKEKLEEKNLPGKTFYATLVKCGLSTLQAVEILSKNLSCPKDQIQYGGLKDRDAITSQQLAFHRINSALLYKQSHPQFFLKDIQERQEGKSISRGNTKGNRFTIFIRLSPEEIGNLSKTNSFINKIRKISNEGFYNFYYLQRFGAPRFINFYWALKILQGDYREAVRSYLGDPGEQELPYFQAIHQANNRVFGQWDEIKKIISPFPTIFSNENRIIDHLRQYPTDFAGALAKIPDQVTLWIYAFSSLLFNEKISFYLRREMPLPKFLPLFLSNKEEDVLVYKDLLQDMGLSPLSSFKNLRPFPFIRRNHNEVSTTAEVKLHVAEVTPEGIAISFSLGTGCYATSFLSHLFNLTSKLAPEGTSKEIIDITQTLQQESLQSLIQRFSITDWKENLF
jgi:TruD family tRNA pseudouridine synthase